MSTVETSTGDELLKILAALGNPHRMRIVAALVEGRDYVSRLAREIGMSRPLLHMHLQRLEAAGLIVGTLEVSDGGKAMKFYEVTPFAYELTPESIAGAARSLSDGTSTDDADPAPTAQAPELPARTAGTTNELTPDAAPEKTREHLPEKEEAK
ncbi:ArsR family transcriptional regulator [Streptomyces sp. AJS327]|uniref:ArsR/SmtB family transcription factor n=1 Tax=Streptomyces sp. AJS327 TaxID=2545265 RepID=UPI0015DDE0E7|nr:winged helix-turn-helix domain-containing protein [Streptomyces sp. AJS327]MBA0053844.1 ArsR family transcriptional regulator [Streptomyces sp. AJS327]